MKTSSKNSSPGGGSPISSGYAKEIGADGYSTNTVEAVKVAKGLLNIA